MKVFAIGASKNIGYFSALHLLKDGHKVVYLLRSTNAFDNDAMMEPYLESGQAILVKGDGLNKSTVEDGWKKANEDSPVDLVLFTVGGTPIFSLIKGFVISPPNLTTHALSNVLQAIASTQSPSTTPPRFIAVTTTGATKESHDALPFLEKGFYSWALKQPHVDKLGMERLLQHAQGRVWRESVEPAEEILPGNWRESMPEAGWMPQTVIIRPALLTDGEEKGVYKVSPDDFASYTISRKDTGHFIGVRLAKEWETWSGKIVNVGY